MHIKAGTSGYRYYHPPEGWKKEYEQKLQAFADNFPLFEINSTFYKLPRVSTAEKWRRITNEVNKKFVFTVKANQQITHPPSSPTYDKADLEIKGEKEECYGYFRPTEEVFTAWNETKQICNALGAEVCLFQTPASFTPSKSHLENMRRFFSQITGDFIFAFEPRGQEWTPDIIQEICNTENLCHVVDPWKKEPKDTLETTYFRLHGLGDQKYKYKFTNQQLKTLKRYCSDYGNTKTYVLFNNYEMFNDCQRFLHYIRTGELPQVPWGAKAVIEEIDVEYPTTKSNILSSCGRWWAWVTPDKSIRVQSALEPVEKKKFENANELLHAITTSTDLQKS